MKKLFVIILYIVNSLVFGQEKFTKITYTELIETNNILTNNNILYFNKKKSIFIPNHKKWETEVKVVGGSTIYPSNTIDSIANKPRFTFYDAVRKLYYNNMINNDIEHLVKNDISNNIKWQDTNDYKTILNHKCRKAIGSSEVFGKTYKYTIWYSIENKSAFGPFRFFHPEGLILELYSEDNFFHFVAEKIETITENPFILIDKYDFSKSLTPQEYTEITNQNTKTLEKDLSEKFNTEIKFKKECKDCN